MYIDSHLVPAYRHCEDITRRAAKNFYFGFVSLPRFRRRAICAVYALSRRWDDIADGDHAPETKKEMLDEEREKLDAMDSSFEDPVYRAVRDTIQRFQIPRQYFYDLLRGVRLDLFKNRYEDVSELMEYCYYVASSPGLIVLEIFGYGNRKHQARRYARELGYAMQLTNILRDVKKDLGRNRIYLPNQVLRREGVDEQELHGDQPTPAVKRVLRRMGGLAERYFHRAKNLFPLLTPSSRTCPLILMELYRTLLKKLKRREFDVFSSPVRLNVFEKWGILLNAVFFHPAAI